MKRGILIDPKDNVGIVIDPVEPGDTIEIDGISITALDSIKLPHKIALKDFQPGDYVLKYGAVIGYATCEIKAGAHVHVHNVDSERLMK